MMIFVYFFELLYSLLSFLNKVVCFPSFFQNSKNIVCFKKLLFFMTLNFFFSKKTKKWWKNARLVCNLFYHRTMRFDLILTLIYPTFFCIFSEIFEFVLNWEIFVIFGYFLSIFANYKFFRWSCQLLNS